MTGLLDKRKFYIDGAWVEPARADDLEVIDPSTEEAVAVISLGDQADTEQGIGDVDEYPAANAERRPASDTTALGHAFADHHREIRSRAGHREQMHQRHGHKFHPVHNPVSTQCRASLSISPGFFERYS